MKVLHENMLTYTVFKISSVWTTIELVRIKHTAEVPFVCAYPYHARIGGAQNSSIGGY